jgi:hypothetical protein
MEMLRCTAEQEGHEPSHCGERSSETGGKITIIQICMRKTIERHITHCGHAMRYVVGWVNQGKFG